ncbi:hypothetical protein I5907_04500 [Panacibacter sp. DH6]|uniref:Uncharacterized protein n=1 Tax=Panacibacter microcysteis TaxID=2793269 RepID=A0A931E111_9BACT|nr:hypothetical protein [Panacibacter microcysteis]MBG9375480.1 hypothetical protein [Panacibacter microcysteis]
MITCFFTMFRLNEKKNYQVVSNKSNFTQKFTDVLNRKYFPLNDKTIRLFYVVFLALFALTLYHFSQLDVAILWKNDSYLLLGNPDRLHLPALASIIHFASGIIAILILIVIILMFKSGRHLMAILLVPFFLYYLTLKVAGNSRWAPLITASALPFLFKPKSIRSLIAVTCTVIITMLLYFGVLFGRNRGNYFSQGVAAIPSNIENGVKSIAILSPKLLATAFSSGWNLSLSLKKYGDKEITFDTKYKILVFSPLISSIDGYNDALEDRNKLKLSSYAPVGFIGESYFLGYGFFLFAIMFLYFAIRYCNKIVARYSLIGMLLVSPAFLFFFKMQGYPIRNCFRYLLIGIVSGFILDWLQKRKSRRIAGNEVS